VEIVRKVDEYVERIAATDDCEVFGRLQLVKVNDVLSPFCALFILPNTFSNRGNFFLGVVEIIGELAASFLRNNLPKRRTRNALTDFSSSDAFAGTMGFRNNINGFFKNAI
jgi:hypothetical protein